MRFIQDAGAEAVVVVNDGNELFTLSNGGAGIDDDLKIPVFNIGREVRRGLSEERSDERSSLNHFNVINSSVAVWRAAHRGAPRG